MTYNLIKYTFGLEIFAFQHIEYGVAVKITDTELNDIEIPEVTEAYTVAENVDITQPFDTSIY